MTIKTGEFQTMARIAAIAMGTCLLAACDGGDTGSQASSGDATGEILEGTISDSMLPVDTVRSQPPLLQEAPTSESSGEDSGAAASDATASPSADADAEASPDAQEASAEESAPAEEAAAEE